MITYIDSENKQNYTVLFDKASAKLGLVPIEKETGIDANGNPILVKYKRVQSDNEWQTVPCVLYDNTPGADNSNADFDEDGNFLVTRAFPVEGSDEVEYRKVIAQPISSLNEYFQHITELAALAIGGGRSGSDPYFLRLPLDEPYFEINANTRAITVPAGLSQIGVVGDKLAEVVFFRIDRYYDAVDLNTRHIYIEWEDAEGNKGISRDYLRDVQSEKDKIIFGWAIGEEITHAVGTVRFAVRFVEWGNKEDTSNAPAQGTGLMYSFSSLPATVTVSDSLHYSLFEDDEEFAFISENTDTLIHNLYMYLEDSEPDSADETAPALSRPPIFIRDLDHAMIANDVIDAATIDNGLTSAEREVYRHNMVGGAKDGPEGYLDLVSSAYSLDGGNITYLYGYNNYIEGSNGDNQAFVYNSDSGTEGLGTTMRFLPIVFTDPEDEEIEIQVNPNEHTVYYEKAADGVYEAVAPNLIVPGVTYYEKVAFTRVNRPGFYHVNARNRVNGLKVTTANSKYLYIPYAAMPQIGANDKLPTRFVIGERTFATARDTDIDQSKRADADKSNIKITQTPAGALEVRLQPHVTAPDNTDTENFTYTWYKTADNHDTDMVNAEVIDGATEAYLDVTTPGCYAVIINNHFNNDDTETALTDAGVCRVTGMPQIPDLTDNWAAFEDVLIAGRENTPALIIPEVDHDLMTFEWHKVTPDNDDLDPIAEEELAVASGTLEFVNGNARIPFVPLEEGFYYFLLTNTLNGATAIMNSATSYGVIDVRRA